MTENTRDALVRAMKALEEVRQRWRYGYGFNEDSDEDVELLDLSAAALSPPVGQAPQPFAYAHKNGAIWRLDNYPAGMDFSEGGWFPLYAAPTEALPVCQPDRLSCFEAESARLREGIADLLKASSEVSLLGAGVGGQWVKLSAALVRARAALSTKEPTHD